MYGFNNPYRKGNVTINMGNRIIVTIMAPNPPNDTRRMASFPRPCSRRWCPGMTERTVPSSGTPKYIEGTNSRSAWDIDMDNRKTASTSGE